MAELVYAYASEAYPARVGSSSLPVPTHMAFEYWSFFKTKKEPVERDPTLPRSVLYSIVNSKDTSIGKEEMLRLVRDGMNTPTAFANGALFVAFKAGAQDPDSQRSLLKAVVKELTDVSPEMHEEARRRVRGIAERSLRRLPEDERVSVAKLKRMNLGGFRAWDARYARAAERLAHDPREVLIVANSMITGLSSFVRSFRDAGKPLHILMPTHIAPDERSAERVDTTNYPAGYSISRHGSVWSFGKYFTRPPQAVVVDDIRRTGKTEERIADFWQLQGDTRPDFEPLEKISAD